MQCTEVNEIQQRISFYRNIILRLNYYWRISCQFLNFSHHCNTCFSHISKYYAFALVLEVLQVDKLIRNVPKNYVVGRKWGSVIKFIHGSRKGFAVCRLAAINLRLPCSRVVYKAIFLYYRFNRINLRWLGTLGRYSAIFGKGKNFCDFLFAFLCVNLILKIDLL